MRSLALALATALPLAAAAQSPAPQPAPPAQEWSPPLADRPETPSPGTQSPESGLDLIQRGLGTVFENLLRDVQPQMEDMARGVEQTFNRFAPVLEDLGTLIDDIGNYQKPERLPNGDILIRRRPDAPPPPPLGNALRDLGRPAPEAPASEPEAAPTPLPIPLPPGQRIEL